MTDAAARFNSTCAALGSRARPPLGANVASRSQKNIVALNDTGATYLLPSAVFSLAP